MSATVILVASLGSDPEIKQSKNGNPYAMLDLVNVYTPFGKEDTYRNFYRVVCFGDQATTSDTLTQGDTVCVVGTLEASIYTPEGGKPKVNLNVKAQSVELLSSGPQLHLPDEDDDSVPF